MEQVWPFCRGIDLNNSKSDICLLLKLKQPAHKQAGRKLVCGFSGASAKKTSLLHSRQFLQKLLPLNVRRHFHLLYNLIRS